MAWLGDVLVRHGGSIVAREGAADAPASLVVAGVDPDAWIGTHVLVAPLRGRSARRRWFVAVSALGAEGPPVVLGPVRVTAARAGGPGGQNVNRRATAVRAEAPALGFSVRVAETRSQAQNRRVAAARLDAKVRAVAAETEARRRAEARDAHDRLERGRPVAEWRLVDDRIVRVEVPPPASWSRPASELERRQGRGRRGRSPRGFR